MSYRFGGGSLMQSDPPKPELCAQCGAELIRSSEAYLACPNLDSKLVPASKWNGGGYSADSDKISSELRAFDKRLRDIFKHLVRDNQRVYFLGETSAQWKNRIKREAAKESIPAGMSVEIERGIERPAA